MPCVENFAAQDAAYRDSVLPPGVPRAGLARGGEHVGLAPLGRGPRARRSGWRASAPPRRPSALYKHFGFTPERVADSGRAAVRAHERTEGADDDARSPQVNPRLTALTEAGVSVWLDQIRRSLVEGGELARMVAEESLRGVTSNPSIFEKAILGSTDYDEELEAARPRAARRAARSTSGSRSATCSCAADVLAERPPRDRRPRRVRLAGGRARPRARHRGDARAARATTGSGSTART